MWSYKILKPAPGVQEDDWYMATNAQALPAIDPKTSTLEEIRSYIKNVATMPLAVDESLRDALTAAVAPPCPIPETQNAPATQPAARLGSPGLVGAGHAGSIESTAFSAE